MMDFHLLVIITCVFLASLLSLLFINKFFRRKTFEEIVAEKKALTDKIYAQSKVAAKKPKKQQPTKKDLKREKKKLQREQQKDNTEQEDSDAQSEQPSVEDEPQGLSKVHVEFNPDPEVIVGATPEAVRRASIAEREKENLSKQKSKKEKKSKPSGILVNKNEPVVVRENLVIEEPANTFEVKQPKDIVELKKHEKKDNNKKEKNAKKEKNVAAEKQAPVVAEQQQQPVAEPIAHAHVAKELKQQDEKARHGSPKTHASNNASSNNKTTKQQNKKQNKETAATKELVLALDKLSDSDTIGVSLLMNLFRRAELNRSEIQILIDYLLNKQQDTPATHSEWSDDICQKLKRQLEEKEKALAEEQEASMGIQAKLRELRTEINTERAQLNATVKVYVEKLQSKEQEITALNQEMQVLNDKFAQERKQFQAKLLLEKQNGSQDLFAQLQRIQSELAHKDKCINDLTCLVNACNQANEELKQQVSLLEQQRAELEQISNNRIFEIEKAKELEVENEDVKLELHNLQNEHESTKADLAQARQELEASAARNAELVEKQNQLVTLQAKNEELLQQLAGINSKAAEQSKEQSGLQTTIDRLKTQLADKEKELDDFKAKNAASQQQLKGLKAQTQLNAQHHYDLQKLVESLQKDVASKHQQLQQIEQTVEKLSSREKELLQQLHEQKEKNDDLRKKNWKLVEALQNAETTARQNKAPTSANASLVQQQQLFATSQKQQSSATANAATVSASEEKHVREIFQRLYPEAVKACASSALSASFEQWVEQVLVTQLKLATASKSASTSSNKSTQSSSNSSSSNHTPSTHTNNNSHIDNLTNNSNNRISNNSSGDGGSSGGGNDVDAVELRLQNTQLRAKVDELTKLVTKTSNTLSALEGHARQEHEKWQSILLSKEEEISRLQHSNGAQDI